jgi:ABC-type transporter Mla subunit MlaD
VKLGKDATAVTDSSIDLTYYLGFLITLVTLLMTVLSYGVFDLNRAKDPAASVVFIAISFGLSLAATAVALYARVDLIQRRDKLFRKQEVTDVLRDRILELDRAYRDLSSVLSGASQQFADDLAKANGLLTRRVDDVIEGARSRLQGFADEAASSERAMREQSISFAETILAKSGELFKQMSGVIEEARTSLNQFVKEASLETSSSALAKAVSDVTASLVKSGEDLSRLFKHLEALEGRAATAMKNVDSLGTSAERASKAAVQVGEALGRVSTGTAALDLEPVRAALAQLGQSVQRLDSATASAEQSYTVASERAVTSMRSKADELKAATEMLSNAFVSVSTELSRSAGVIADIPK